ncbi:hypothetical protein E6W36_15600 [Hankyongella ginsenosidimutans]|uniref:TonB C-terminal domain-containing protein n=1 Tax=Hankyongella ginsenosidimutans TaxID=1763828 RepID=A0A4D7C8L2_9SPHN|nr:hypothetical protein E6W36_15600 [Hankyongella ginsenosidimutans]
MNPTRARHRSARKRGDQGLLSIEADGKISNIEVTQSSGSDILDRESQKSSKRLVSFRHHLPVQPKLSCRFPGSSAK